jgi:hypothetical protein
MFALKEGGEIRQDLMDYSLLLLQRHCSEIMKSSNTTRNRVFMMDATLTFLGNHKRKDNIPNLPTPLLQ